ncbi:MAG: hypothetical protein U1E56_08405 [Bauldia sp.]
MRRFLPMLLVGVLAACSSDPVGVAAKIEARYLGRGVQDFVADFGRPLFRAGDRHQVWEIARWPGHCRVVLRVENQVIRGAEVGVDAWLACQRVFG